MKKLILLFCLLPLVAMGSKSVMETGGQVSAPVNFWLYEAGLEGNSVDLQFQTAVQAVQNNGTNGGGGTNHFISTPTIQATTIGGSNAFNVFPGIFDLFGQATNSAAVVSNYVTANYTTTTNNGNLIWQFTSPALPTTVYKSGNFGANPYEINIYTNGILHWSYVFGTGGKLIAPFFSGDGHLLTNIDSGLLTNISGTLPSNTIPQNLGISTMTIANPSSANASFMLGLGPDGKTVVSNAVPAGSTPPKFISGTNTLSDVVGGSNRVNVPFGIFDLINSAFNATNGWPWLVLSQPANTVLTNLSSFNGFGVTNLQVVQNATFVLTNQWQIIWQQTANGNSNLVMYVNTNMPNAMSAQSLSFQDGGIFTAFSWYVGKAINDSAPDIWFVSSISNLQNTISQLSPEGNWIMAGGFQAGVTYGFNDNGVGTIQFSNTFVLPSYFTNPTNRFTGDGSGLTGLNGSSIASGTVSTNNLPIASSTLFGLAEFDGTTITRNASGQWQSSGGGSGSVSNINFVDSARIFHTVDHATNFTFDISANSVPSNDIISLNAGQIVGALTTVTASSPLASSGGTTPNISVALSTGGGSIVESNAPTIVTPTLVSPIIPDAIFGAPAANGANYTNLLVLQGLIGSSDISISFAKNVNGSTNATATIQGATGTGGLTRSNAPTLTSPNILTSIGGTPAINGLNLTNEQVVQSATIVLSNNWAIGWSQNTKGNSNLIFMVSTNSALATATNIAQGAAFAGGQWQVVTDAINDLIITNNGKSFIFQTNGQFIVGQSGGATLQLGMATNNTPGGTFGNGSFISNTNGQYYGVSNGAVFQIIMP